MSFLRRSAAVARRRAPPSRPEAVLRMGIIKSLSAARGRWHRPQHEHGAPFIVNRRKTCVTRSRRCSRRSLLFKHRFCQKVYPKREKIKPREAKTAGTEWRKPCCLHISTGITWNFHLKSLKNSLKRAFEARKFLTVPTHHDRLTLDIKDAFYKNAEFPDRRGRRCRRGIGMSSFLWRGFKAGHREKRNGSAGSSAAETPAETGKAGERYSYHRPGIARPIERGNPGAGGGFPAG